MGWFNRMFGGETKGESKSERAVESPSHQLPSNIVAEEFGEVNVRQTPTGYVINFTILMEPEGAEAEGWQTGVALDASASMQNAFGFGLIEGPAGPCPNTLIQDYLRRNWVQSVETDGQKCVYWSEQASEDAIRRGHFRRTDNVVEPVAQEMIGYLAGQLDADGGTTVIYWACGTGSDFEVLGDFTVDQCSTMTIAGPTKAGFGNGTHLLPAMKYFVDRFADADRGMYLFITDGKLDDLKAVKKYTIQLCKEIQKGKRKSVKCVLIGIGDQIDEGQMEELDDLDSGTDVDIWDHKIAKEMRSLVEIFAEVVNENKIVASTATIYDDSGKAVVTFADGLPAKVTFSMPLSSKAFELEVGERRIRQTIVTA